MSIRFAKKVVPGDEVLVPENNELTPAIVVKVSSIKLKGNYIHVLFYVFYFNLSIQHVCHCDCNIQNFFSISDNQYIFFLGAFVPLTQEGDIMVNGILASCYASFHHDLAHIAMIPMKLFPKAVEWFFCVQNGSPDFVDAIKKLGRSMLPAGSLI